MFEIRSSYNSQSSVHFESQQQNVRTMLFIPREIWERALLHNTAIVNCLWVKQKVLLAEVFIVYERATTKKLLFNRRNGYPQTYLYYYYYLPPIKVLRIKLLLSWFPVYYPVTKNVRVSWKNLEQRKGPRKKNANFTQNSPLMANLLLLPEKKEATSTEVLFWVYGQIESRSVNLGNGGTAPCCITNLLPITT